MANHPNQNYAVKSKGTVPHFFDPSEDKELYHYTSESGAIGILNSAAMWLSDYTKMNDPSEYLYARERYIHHYSRRETFISETARFSTTFTMLGLENNTHMLIGCFTPDASSESQWNQYAEDGAGCVFGIDPIFLAERAGVTVRRVVYDDDKLKAFLNAGWTMLQTELEDPDSNDGVFRELAAYFVSDLFAFKHPKFADEQEIRISRMVIKTTEAQARFEDVGGHAASGKFLPPLSIKARQGAYGPTSYVELPLVDEDGCAIQSVKMGANSSSEFRERVTKHPLVQKYTISVV